MSKKQMEIFQCLHSRLYERLRHRLFLQLHDRLRFQLDHFQRLHYLDRWMYDRLCDRMCGRLEDCR